MTNREVCDSLELATRIQRESSVPSLRPQNIRPMPAIMAMNSNAYIGPPGYTNTPTSHNTTRITMTASSTEREMIRDMAAARV
jgi:hypothetical protein